LNLFPSRLAASTKVLFVNFGEKEQDYCMNLAGQLRQADIATEIYPSAEKMKKQMKFANDKSIPIVVLIGENEMKDKTITYKNMITGEQFTTSQHEFVQYLKVN